jgi:hypothetical protein
VVPRTFSRRSCGRDRRFRSLAARTCRLLAQRAEIILTSGGREQWQLLWVARLLGRLQAVADDSQDDQRDGEARPGSLCRLLAARQQRVVRKVVANDRAAKRVGALNQGVDNAGLVLRGLDGLREQGR